MRRILSICIIILLFISILFAEDAFSWSGATHRILSYYAASNSVLKKENYLVDYLGFQKGLEEILTWEDKSQTVSFWMQSGSVLEDEGGAVSYITGKARSFNHFHHPLKEDWANAGLDDYVIIPNPAPPFIPYQLHVTGDSAPIWAQDGDTQIKYPGGDWSWKVARDLYYIALVSAAEKDRQAYFALLFRGLGHQMHLIQDMAVPSHTRNDAHPEQSLQYNEYLELYFEPWAAKNAGFISEKSQEPDYPTVSLNTKINNYVPITQLTDANEYNGSNPSTSTDIGLAEYTNANFFSDDTIFAAEEYPSGHWHYFPYPKESDTDLQDYINQGKLPEITTAWDGIDDLGIWISKKSGNEIEIEHFLKPTYLTYYLLNIPIYYRTFYRDEKCHEDYAKELVPRAVGYSVALLDYFFRGKIKVILPENAITFETITIEAQNITENAEEMPDGEIKLVVKYSRNGEFYYALADPINNNADSIPWVNPCELVFPNVIPNDVKDFVLQVVYRGKLGLEEEAVAVGSKSVKRGVIALYKNLGTEQDPIYDWWYYLVDSGEGYHDDPKAPFPSKPEIFSKWWSCDGLEEVEYYTRATPALIALDSGGCGDDCGLVNFKSAQCCGGSSSSPNTQEDWVVLPCGGEPGYIGWWYGWGGKHISSCSECGNGEETMWTPGARSTRSRTSNYSSNCDKGTSWDLSIDQLTEKMEIGPRHNTAGNESSSIASVVSSQCGPYEKAKMCCPVCSQDGCQCTWMWFPSFCGTVCESNFSCEGWHPVEDGGWTRCTNKTFRGTDTYGGQHGSNYQGCALFDIASRSSGYGTMDAEVVTKVKVGEVETTFEGSWSSYSAQEGNESVNNVQRGWNTLCLSCPQGAGQGETHSVAHFSFSETSYGIAGWRTVVASDGRFAVLMPEMNLSASATSTDGNVSGSISSTTIALLRIVDIIDENPVEEDFELAAAHIGYALDGMPNSRDDLGIKPNCWSSDLPLDIELRGLHWYSDDAFLVAFFLKDVFYAYLIEKDEEAGWLATQLTDFEWWVKYNDLTDYLMFLK